MSAGGGSSHRTRYLVLALLVLALRARCGGCGGDGCGAVPPLVLGTFNIEDYPRSDRQEQGALDLIRDLRLQAVALQEITQPLRLQRAARERLGKRWRFVYPVVGPTHRTGVLFDEDVLRLVSTRVHHETELDGGGKPTFEVRLRPRQGPIARLLVVHLKAGGDGVERRARQLLALEPVLRQAVASGERVVLLGDFNATSLDDRRGIAALAAATGLHWASEGLACTSYWNRNDGCVGSPLDHILSPAPPRHIAARGPCETEGCARRDRCPVFHREISDHCPVTIELAPPP
jgi:endonuclease/exonuclease/phosphatase family metal-dependent hydrolase